MLQGFIGLVIGGAVGSIVQRFAAWHRYEDELQTARMNAAQAEMQLRQVQQNFQQSLNQRTREVRAEASRRLTKRLLGDDWEY